MIGTIDAAVFSTGIDADAVTGTRFGVTAAGVSNSSSSSSLNNVANSRSRSVSSSALI